MVCPSPGVEIPFLLLHLCCTERAKTFIFSLSISVMPWIKDLSLFSSLAALHKQNNFPGTGDSINLSLYAVSANFPFVRGKKTTSPHETFSICQIARSKQKNNQKIGGEINSPFWTRCICTSWSPFVPFMLHVCSLMQGFETHDSSSDMD